MSVCTPPHSAETWEEKLRLRKRQEKRNKTYFVTRSDTDARSGLPRYYDRVYSDGKSRRHEKEEGDESGTLRDSIGEREIETGNMDVPSWLYKLLINSEMG